MPCQVAAPCECFGTGAAVELFLCTITLGPRCTKVVVGVRLLAGFSALVVIGIHLRLGLGRLHSWIAQAVGPLHLMLLVLVRIHRLHLRLAYVV